MDFANLLKGILKQQCLDNDGIYTWEKKLFCLDVQNKILVISMIDNNNDDTNIKSSVSLRGAKYAKEWSFSSSLAGYGFDLVWSSGKIWSFLVENENNCKKWVEYLNISLTIEDSIHDQNHLKLPIPPAPTYFEELNNSMNNSICNSLNDTKIDIHSPVKKSISLIDPPTVARFGIHSFTRELHEVSQQPQSSSSSISNGISNQSIGINQIELSDNLTIISCDSTNAKISMKTHDHSNIETINDHKDIKIIPNKDDSFVDFMNRIDDISGTPKDINQPTNNHTKNNDSNIEENKNYKMQQIKNIIQDISKPILNTQQKLISNLNNNHITNGSININDNHSIQNTSANFEDNYYSDDIKEKNQELELIIQRKQIEFDNLKQRYVTLHNKYDDNIIEFEKRLDLVKEKEIQLIRETKKDLENKLLRASNDNMNYHDAALKAMKLQHDRELQCFRDELSEERRRHTDLICRAQSLREKAEHSEQDCQRELVNYKDKCNNITIELNQFKRLHDNEKATWDRERKRFIADSEAIITHLKDENEKNAMQYHQDLKSKVIEMNEKMTKSLQKIKISDADIIREELEGERLRIISEIQKQCQKEIEMVRTEERRLAAIEIDNVRQAFLTREHQTSDDVIQLEKLHSIRVSQLEKQLYDMKLNYQLIEEKLNKATKELQYGTFETKQSNADMKAIMETHAHRAEALHKDLQLAHHEIQELKAREVSYREELTKALTQSRIQHAELLEAKQQASSGNAQAYQWKNVIKESEVSLNTAETTLQIAKDEVIMLERTLHRAQHENQELKIELMKADRLIYGTSQFKNNIICDIESPKIKHQPFHSKLIMNQSKISHSTPTNQYIHTVSPDLLSPTISTASRYSSNDYKQSNNRILLQKKKMNDSNKRIVAKNTSNMKNI